MIVRLMRKDDIREVQEIDKLSFSLPWPSRAYEYELFENTHSICWVAETNTDDQHSLIVGMMVIWLIIDEAHIATIATHPQYRRQGVARALLRRALIDVIEKGAASATLEVRDSNIAAKRLYDYFGFQIVGKRPKYYADNHEDAILMTVYELGNQYLKWLKEGFDYSWSVFKNKASIQ